MHGYAIQLFNTVLQYSIFEVLIKTVWLIYESILLIKRVSSFIVQ